MNTPRNPTPRNETPNDAPSGIDPYEWELQERARLDAGARMEAAGASAPPAGDVGDARAYARIAQALRAPLPERLPSNFAHVVAHAAETRARAARQATRMEQGLVRGLVAAMAVAGLVVTLLYARNWLAELDAAAGAGASGWALAAAACLLLTWAVQGRRTPRRNTA